MLITVTGGSGSGKSEYAEKLAQRLRGIDAPVYLATMQVYGEEGQKRVRRHRKLRAGKGFVTVEKTKNLPDIPADILRRRTVLLEDFSNLISNELFAAHEMIEEEMAFGRVMEDTAYLRSLAGNLIIVMNEVFSDGRQYDDGTEVFRRLTGRLNRELARTADESYEVVYGIPVRLSCPEA